MIIRILFFMFLIFTSCSTMDLYIKENALLNKPGKILIGYFEKRSIEYEPYIEMNFRDALRFQFFQLGYNSIVVKLDGKDNEKNDFGKRNLKGEEIKKIINSYSGDIYIQGAISERDVGDIADNKTSTSVIFLIYDKNGEKIGEALYLASETMVDASIQKEISSKFAENLHNQFK